MRKFISSVVLVMSVGCATASLNPNAQQVRLESAPPPGGCDNLGMVIGEGGGTFGGGWISNDKLVEYATNDARNKAAEKGANYLQVNAPQLGGGSGTTTTASVTGIAYRCPNNAAQPASASSAQPASASSAQPAASAK